MTGAARWWLVSDLHLDGSEGDTDVAGALAALVDVVTETSEPGERHLVLLGDSFELATWTDDAEEAVERLNLIARRLPEALASLGRAVRSGAHVHLVCGNHDVDLVRPAVQRQLVRLVLPADPEDAGRLLVHPWILHVPGLLYAEHGHQHHEPHRMPTLLEAMRESRPPGPVPPLAAFVQARGQGQGPATVGRRVALAAWLSWRCEREARRPRHQRLLRAYARDLGLPAETLVGLHAASRLRPGRAAITVGARTLGRAMGRGGDPNGYLRRAALRVDGVLGGSAERPACYVFGHTHVATVENLRGSGRFFVNTGSWAGPRPGLPVVLVEAVGERVDVRLVTLERPRPPRPANGTWPPETAA